MVRIQLFGSSDAEHFELVRDIETGLATGVITTSGSFSPFSGNIAARLIDTDKKSNFPINIRTYSIDRTQLKRDVTEDGLSVIVSHEMLSSNSNDDFAMVDLSP